MGKLQWATIGLCLVGGCGIAGGNNDLRPTEVSLASAATLGQAAQIALSAMSGSGSVQCANVVTSCADYPCEGEVQITYGAGCPLPLGGEAIGTTTVTGTWMSGEEASLDFTFTDVRVGDRGAVVASATTIDASRNGQITTIEFTGSRAVARGGVALAGATVWDVMIDDMGTPDDPSDDSYTIDGSNTAAGGVSATVISVDMVVLTAECRANPVAGEVRITESGLTNIRTDTLTFHAACDGMAELETTLGGPDPVELDFLDEE